MTNRVAGAENVGKQFTVETAEPFRLHERVNEPAIRDTPARFEIDAVKLDGRE
jgi:hypothetical protein